jgi:hypothetical protein
MQVKIYYSTDTDEYTVWETDNYRRNVTVVVEGVCENKYIKAEDVRDIHGNLLRRVDTNVMVVAGVHIRYVNRIQTDDDLRPYYLGYVIND